MASQRTEFGGQLAARLTGLNALSVAVIFGLSPFRLFGERPDANEAVVFWSLLFAVVFAVIGVVFLAPKLSRWLIRERYFYASRMSFAVAKLVIAGTIWCGLMVAALISFPEPQPELVFFVFLHVTTSTLYFIALFVFPGGYAARLGAAVPPPLSHAPRKARRPVPAAESGANWLHMLIAAPLFIVGAAGLYGDRWATFVPTLDLSRFAYQSSLIFLVYCLVLGVVAAHFGRLHLTGFWLLRSRAINLMVAPAVFVALGVMTFTPAVTMGLPDIHARLTPGPPAFTTVRVVGVADSTNEGRCPTGIYVISEMYFSKQPHRICEVSRGLWQQLSSGDDIRLEGHRTAFGFHYSDVRAQ